MNSSSQVPYWRLSSFYFAYFAALGAFIPYWSLYLQSINFDAEAIGLLSAILVGSKIVAPNLLGWMADHSGKRMRIIRIGSLISVIAFVGAFFTTSFWGLAFVMLSFGFFWNATLAQYEVTTLNYLKNSSYQYSHIRLWGSIGFILIGWLLGLLFEKIEIRYLVHVIFFIMILILISSFLVNDKKESESANEKKSIVSTLSQWKVIGLILGCIFMQGSHGPYYTFYSIYLEENNYSLSFIGQMWALGVIAEVFVFAYMHKLSQCFTIKALFLASILITAVRWSLIASFVDNLAIIIFAQLLHAASFALYHACAITLFHEYFTGSIQGRGQALYSSAGYGLGITLGTYLSGLVWDKIGGTQTFLWAAVCCVIAFVIVLFSVTSDRDKGKTIRNPDMMEQI